MKILVLGKDGQVGWELQRALAPLGDVVALGRSEADLENHDALRRRVREVAPQIVVNAAAYTAVDKAESEPGRARNINADAVAALAEETRRLDGWLVHYSTDYVFDGRKPGAYTETDATAPESVYGRTKRDGEEAVRAAGGRHLTFRTSWVYAARGRNFAKTILRLATERDELKVVNDQLGAPTGAELIADVTALCLSRLTHDPALAERATGTYHLVAGGETSWHGYAQLLLAEARRHGAVMKTPPERVRPISTAEYPLPATRPLNSRLDTTKLRTTFGLRLPPWEEGVRRVVEEMMGSGK
jgi:dTDP-4-dehydrorhamnose reductase